MATRSTYPVHVAAELEPGLSRWVWLVKWLLVIPHYVVLCFLWAALVESAGSGHQAITWTPENGDWTAVVMNLDGSRGVAVEVTAGAELPVLRDLTLGMGVLAAVVLVGGALLVAAALRSASRDGRPAP